VACNWAAAKRGREKKICQFGVDRKKGRKGRKEKREGPPPKCTSHCMACWILRCSEREREREREREKERERKREREREREREAVARRKLEGRFLVKPPAKEKERAFVATPAGLTELVRETHGAR
jgi:hypothetical protein